uniref:Predicted protein n=1 Tax=Hordeum vulgare subsp. vulgare TaxID=112509 RepID=F2D841_HORVV|nr:predicted protein [Hordeum vulgare subsp. vulgare]BAK06475.1 predicted protein [Hordeum vulgare subsp. vulgare]
MVAQPVEPGRHDGGHVDVIMALKNFAPPALHTNAAILLQHSRGKSALIFCSTRKRCTRSSTVPLKNCTLLAIEQIHS